MASRDLLVFKTPDGSKSELDLVANGETSIGRHPDCTLTVSQPSVSRRHARLWREGDEWHVEDLQSSNGTYVNNRRITKATISEGDEVRCGDFALTYVIEAGESDAPSSRPAPPALPPSPPAPPPRVVGKLGGADEAPPPAVVDRATVGLDDSADVKSNIALLELQEERDALLEELESWKTKVSTAQQNADRKDSEIEDLEGQVEDLETDLSGLRAELASVRTQLEGSQSNSDEELNASREELATVRDELDALRETNTQLLSDLEAAQTEVAKNDDDERVEALEGELNTLRQTNSQLRDELDSAQAAAEKNDDDERLRVLEGELASAEEARVSAEQDRDAAQAELSEAKVALRDAEESTRIHRAPRETELSEVGGDLDEVSSQLRNEIMLAGRLFAELAPLVNVTEDLRRDGLPGQVGVSIKNVVEETDGAGTMSAAQEAIIRSESLIRAVRRIARQLRESS